MHVSPGMVISINITIVKLIKSAQNTFKLLRQKIGAKEEMAACLKDSYFTE
jgi:hypothetical protein